MKRNSSFTSRWIDLSNYPQGGVTGSLTSLPLVFDNTIGAANLFDQGVTEFGSGFNFDITLDGPAIDLAAADGSEFFVYLLGTDFNGLVLGTGQVASIVINGEPSVTFNPTLLSTINAVAAVPEPGTLLTCIGGLALALTVSEPSRKFLFPAK